VVISNKQSNLKHVQESITNTIDRHEVTIRHFTVN
jgi:hypothetical protein